MHLMVNKNPRSIAFERFELCLCTAHFGLFYRIDRIVIVLVAYVHLHMCSAMHTM